MGKGLLYYRDFEGKLSSFYGRMGEPTNIKNIYVGDLVTVRFKDGRNNVFTGLVIQNGFKFNVMGACGVDLKEYDLIHKALPYTLITSEIAENLHSITIVEPKKMTLEQIEKELGYKIEIVEGEK